MQTIVLRVLVRLLVLITGMGAAAEVHAGEPPASQPSGLLSAVPGEFVVKLRDNPDAQNMITAMGADDPAHRPLRLSERERTYLVHPPKPEGVVGPFASQEIRAALASSPAVASVEPNYIYYSLGVPDDPRARDQWHLAKVDAYRAWDTQHDTGVLVAVIDTGVYWEHDDLQGNIWTNPAPGAAGTPFAGDLHGWNFFNGNNNVTCEKVARLLVPGVPILGEDPVHKTYEAHATHVAGIIGAIGNNTVGVAGVAWKVQLMPLKFMGGSASSGTLANAVAAIDYAVRHKARIINASWGSKEKSQILRDQIALANDAGVLFVAAAGNGDGSGRGTDNDASPTYPAAYDLPNIIAVASTDPTDVLASDSNFGVKSVQVGAPGEQILSTVPAGDENSSAPSAAYGSMSGTSMAAPIVSGMAALIMAHYPSLSHTEVKKIIERTCDDATALRGKTVTGARVNLARALDNLPLPGPVMARLNALSAEQASIAEKRITPEVRAQLFVRDMNVEQPLPRLAATNPLPQAVVHDLVVKLRPDQSPEQIAGSLTDAGIKMKEIKRVVPNQMLYQFKIESTGSGSDAIEQLKRAGVLSAERNTTFTPAGGGAGPG